MGGQGGGEVDAVVEEGELHRSAAFAPAAATPADDDDGEAGA